MSNGYLSHPLIFIIDTLATLYIATIMLRFLLGLVRADFYNPVSQFLVVVTKPLLHPLRRIIPGYRSIDIAALVLMLFLQMITLFIIGFIKSTSVAPQVLLVMAIAKLLALLINVYLFSILAVILLSWFSKGYHPISALLYRLTEPALKPARRFIPPIAGIDLSPMVVILALFVAEMLLLPPLYLLADTVR